MDVFEKCYSFTQADEVKAKGLYPYFKTISANEGPVVTINGRNIIMAGSNNYLGFTAHPKVKEAAIEATKKYGTGCSGSRYLTGNLELHEMLEERLANFLGYESVLLFSTGFQTALGSIPTLATKGDYIITDKENHSSIVNAILLAKGTLTNFVRFKHNEMADLERVLSQIPEENGKLIVTDGVFSVTGVIANLPEINRLAKKYNARILVDDAHAIGVIGKGGRGTASYFDLTNEIDLTMGTFSKTFSSLGGFIAGPERVINYLKHHSHALIFSASPTPASCAAALTSLDLLIENPELINKLIANSKYIQQGFKNLGLKIIESDTAIVPVIIGDTGLAFLVWKKLFDLGIFVNAFIPPGVPPNMSMMKTSYMATHEKEHLDIIIEGFKKVSKELNLIK